MCAHAYLLFVVCTFVDARMLVCVEVHIYLQYIHISFLRVLSSELGTKVVVDGILALLQSPQFHFIIRDKVGMATIMISGTKW